MSVGAGVVLDGSVVLVGLAAGGLVVLVGLAVDGLGVWVAVAVDGIGILVGVWVTLEPGLGGGGGLFADAVAVDGAVGDWTTAGGVGVALDTGLSGDGVGVCVTVTCIVADGDPEGRNAFVPSDRLLATTVAITHIKLAAISAPMVSAANRGNERLLFIRLLPGQHWSLMVIGWLLACSDLCLVSVQSQLAAVQDFDALRKPLFFLEPACCRLA